MNWTSPQTALKTDFHHVSVMPHELLNSLQLEPGDCVVDCTIGGGGHADLCLQRIGPTGLLIGIDRDKDALGWCQKRFSEQLKLGNIVLEHGTFSQILTFIQKHGRQGRIKAIYADIGTSSPQFDWGNRGFSFAHDGPLDMRMNQLSDDLTAESIVNNATEIELTRYFQAYGEEPKGRFFARKIVERRALEPFHTTRDLADFIVAINPYKAPSLKHPATRIFQALRIVVNDEIGELKNLLQLDLDILAPFGRFAIISFHSLEDREVKKAFQALAGKIHSDAPRDLQLILRETSKSFAKKATIIKPFPIIPSNEEISANPRARSAKLRVIEKL